MSASYTCLGRWILAAIGGPSTSATRVPVSLAESMCRYRGHRPGGPMGQPHSLSRGVAVSGPSCVVDLLRRALAAEAENLVPTPWLLQQPTSWPYLAHNWMRPYPPSPQIHEHPDHLYPRAALGCALRCARAEATGEPRPTIGKPRRRCCPAPLRYSWRRRLVGAVIAPGIAHWSEGGSRTRPSSWIGGSTHLPPVMFNSFAFISFLRPCTVESGPVHPPSRLEFLDGVVSPSIYSYLRRRESVVVRSLMRSFARFTIHRAMFGSVEICRGRILG